MPGTLFELATPQPRAALAAVAGMPGVRSAHLYGDVVRVLWTGDDRGADELTSRLLAAGVPVSGVQTSPGGYGSGVRVLDRIRAPD